MTKRPTLKDLETYAQNDPLIHTALMYVWRGECTLEQSLIALAIYQSDIIQKDSETLRKYIERFGTLEQDDMMKRLNLRREE